MIKTANTQYPVNELIKKRWSPRSFSDRPIAEDILLSLFEAASWAASSRNEQPWRFIIGVKGQGNTYNLLFDSLVEWNQKWAHTAPVLALGLAKTVSDHKDYPNHYALYDLGQAMATLSIQAMANEIYVHQIGGFDKEKILEHFDLPNGVEPVVAFAMGYLGEPSALADDFRQMEDKPRSRKELKDIIIQR